MILPQFILTALVFYINMVDCRRLDLTNIKCTTFDKTFSDFEYCYLKAVNRTSKYISIKVLLLKTPIHQFSVNVLVYKRSNGVLPINYNFTFDGCTMLENNRNPIKALLMEFLKGYTNINHSCPYDHDIIVDKLPSNFINHRLGIRLPFPEGDYVFSSNWLAFGINRANVRIHASYI